MQRRVPRYIHRYTYMYNCPLSRLLTLTLPIGCRRAKVFPIPHSPFPIPHRRAKVFLARRSARRKREARSLANSSAASLLAQTSGVAQLEKVIKRHRASNAVMWGVYSQVTFLVPS